MEHWWNDTDRVNPKYSGTNQSSALCPPQIPHGLACVRTPPSAVTDRWQTAKFHFLPHREEIPSPLEGPSRQQALRSAHVTKTSSRSKMHILDFFWRYKIYHSVRQSSGLVSLLVWTSGLKTGRGSRAIWVRDFLQPLITDVLIMSIWPIPHSICSQTAG